MMLSGFCIRWIGARDPNSEYLAACRAIEAAVSTASDVYYSGEYGWYRVGETISLMDRHRTSEP